jgi:hypothetical protein
MIVEASINLAEDGTTEPNKFRPESGYVGQVRIGTELYGVFFSEATVSFKTEKQVKQFIKSLEALLDNS